MDLITLSALGAAANTASDSGGGGGGGGGVAERTDEHYANTVLLLHGDGNPGANNVNNPAPEAQFMAFSDESPSDKKLTADNTVYGTDFSPYYYNNGSFTNSFDGTSTGALTITQTDDRTDLSGTVDFTIRFWIFPRSTGQSSFSEIFSRGKGSTYSGYRVGMPSGESTIYFGINYAGSSIGANFSKSSALPLNEWTHVVITREASTMKIYLNGVLDATNASFTGNPNMASDDVIYLGRGSYDTSNRQFNGLLNSFELIKGRNLYSANFTPPVAPTEDPTTEGELSISSDASGDYLQLTGTDFSTFDFGTGPFTIEFWVFYDTLGTTILGQTGWGNVVQIRSNKFEFYQAASAGNSGAYWITGTVDAVVGRWYHVVFQRNDAGVLDLWVNGTREATNSTYASTAMKFHSTKGDICFRYWNGGASAAVDKISNFRIQRGAVYATGTSITVPTAPFTRDANTVLLTCQSKNIRDTSVFNHGIDRKGDPHVSEVGPFGDGYWSNDFDGTSDSLTITSTAALQLPDEFTIEFFMKLDTVVVDTQHPSPITFPSNGSYVTQVYVQATSGYVGLYYNGDIVKSSNGSIVANKWYHVAVGRDSSDQIALWLDGVRVATATNGFSVGNSSGTFRVGSYSGTGGDINGKISNLRIVKGSDVYGYSNATITVPTSPLTKISGTSLLTCQSNRFIDNSDSGYSLTVNGNTSIDELIPFEYLKRQTKLITCQENRFRDTIQQRWILSPTGGGAKVFTLSPFGVNASYRTANTGAGFSGTDASADSFVKLQNDIEYWVENDFEYEMWFYPNYSPGAAYDVIWSSYDGSTGYGLYLYQSGSSAFLHVRQEGTTFNSPTGTFDWSVQNFAWNHARVIRSGSRMVLFVNGVQVAQGSHSTVGRSNATHDFFSNGANGDFAGYISNFRLVKGGVKHASQANTFPIVPTSPIANTGVLPSNSYSIYFDGNDHLANTNVIPMSDIEFGKHNDWTIEGWINSYDVSDRQILDWRPGSSTNKNCPNIGLNASSKIELYINTGTAISSRVLSVGKWYHFAFVRSGGSTKLYLDGLEEGSTYADTVDYVADKLTIGAQVYSGATAQYYGWLHGLNVLNGVTKYSSNTSVTYSPVSKTGTQLTTGYSWDFNRGVYNGTYPYYSILGESDFVVGTNDFTIEAWIYIDNFTQSSIIASQRAQPTTVAATVYPHFIFNVNTSGQLQLQTRNTSGTQFFAKSATGTIKAKVWYHVAATRASGALKVYINGVHHSHETANDSAFNLTEDDFCIGGYRVTSYSSMFAGNIHSLRFIIGTALYTSNFTPSTEPLTTTSQGATASEVKFLGCQNDTFINNATNNIQGSGFNGSTSTGTLVNTSGPGVSTFNPFDNGYWSTYFDGTDDYIDIPGQTSALSGQWSLELWFMKQDSSTDVIVSTDTTDQFQLVIQDSGDFHFSYNGTSPIFDVASGTSLHEWFHICITRDGSNYVRGYINGVLKAYVYNTGNPTLNGFSVGDQRSTGAHDTFGKVSNLRLVVGSIPTSYQSSETSLGTSVFTAPTDYLTRSSQGATAGDVELLICQSGALIDNSQANSGIGYTITASGDAKVSRSRPFSTELARDQVVLACQDVDPIKDNSHLDTKFTKTGDLVRHSFNPFDNGFWSGQFDGTGDYLKMTHATAFDFSGQMSVECWFKLSAAVNWGILVAQETTDRFQLAVTNSDTLDVRWNGSQLGTPFTVRRDIWHHLLITRDSSNNVKQFLDGVLKNNNSNSNTLDTAYLTVGARGDAANPFNGFIHGVRVINGSIPTGYQTSETTTGTKVFTPPTEAVNTTSQGATSSDVKLLTCVSSNFVDRSNSFITVVSNGNANTAPTRPYSNTAIAQDTKLLTMKYPGSIRNIGFLDESSNNSPIIVGGGVTQGSFTPHYPASGYWSNYFDGTGDYLKVDSDIGTLTGDFTIECFFYQLSTGTYRTIFSSTTTYTTSNQIRVSTGNSNDTLRVASGSSDLFDASSSFSNNQWYHMALVRSGTTLTLYLDGTSVGSVTNSTSFVTSQFQIGDTQLSSTHYYFYGYISNVRVTNGTALYTGTFTPSTSPLTTTSQSATASEVKLLTCQSNRFIDNSGDANSLTVNGNSKVQPFFPFDLTTSYDAYDHGGSAFFDGDGDYLNYEQSGRDTYAGDFTTEGWIYPISNDADTQWRTIYFDGQASSTQIALQADDSGKLTFYDGSHIIKSTSTPPLNSWTHFAIVRSGTGSNNMSLYINGTRESQATSTTSFGHASGKAFIGSYSASGGNFHGYISNFRFVRDQAIYSGATITVPTSPTRPISNTVLQLDFTNAGIYDSTAKNVITLVNETQISTGAANTKFGTGSISYDGAGDYLTLPHQPNLVMGTGDFTWEMFLKYYSPSYGTFYLFDQRNTASQAAIAVYYESSTTSVDFYVSGAARIQGDLAINPGEWQHFALVRYDGSTKIYVNGRQTGATYSDTNNYVAPGLTYFGARYSAEYFLNGAMDEIRITKGFARYTANFTPMTAASGNKSS